MPNDAASIARRLFDAYAKGDRAGAEALIAPDFHFTSPLDNHIDRAKYFELCWPNSQVITGFDIVRLVTHHDQVIVTYVGRNREGHQFRNTEVLTIREGQLVEVEVYFGWSIPHRAPEGTHVGQP